MVLDCSTISISPNCMADAKENTRAKDLIPSISGLPSLDLTIKVRCERCGRAFSVQARSQA